MLSLKINTTLLLGCPKPLPFSLNKKSSVSTMPNSENAPKCIRIFVSKAPLKSCYRNVVSWVEAHMSRSGYALFLTLLSHSSVSTSVSCILFDSADKLSSFGEDLKPNSLMRKSPSLESVIKSPVSLGSRSASFSYGRGTSKLRYCHFKLLRSLDGTATPYLQENPAKRHQKWSNRFSFFAGAAKSHTEKV